MQVLLPNSLLWGLLLPGVLLFLVDAFARLAYIAQLEQRCREAALGQRQQPAGACSGAESAGLAAGAACTTVPARSGDNAAASPPMSSAEARRWVATVSVVWAALLLAVSCLATLGSSLPLAHSA